VSTQSRVEYDDGPQKRGEILFSAKKASLPAYAYSPVNRNAVSFPRSLHENTVDQLVKDHVGDDSDHPYHHVMMVWMPIVIRQKAGKTQIRVR
jgi:hypothetical protein